MRYVVFGAGAVGGVIGARLHLAGLAVTLVARGEHLTTIRRDGLQLDTEVGPQTARAAVVGSAADVTWTRDTVILLCVKAHQTAPALADLVSHAPELTPVVCAQNGVANEPVVLRSFARTYGLCVMLPALHLRPGVVVQKCWPTPGILDLGRFPSGVDEVALAVSDDLREAGFECVARSDIMAWKHRKLLVNAVGDVGALFSPGETVVELAQLIHAEGEAVLAAAGIEVTSAARDVQRRGSILQARSDIAAFAGNSLRQSLMRGLDSEIDFRAGEIVLLGRLHGVPTPANELVLRTARGAAAGRGSLITLDRATIAGLD